MTNLEEIKHWLKSKDTQPLGINYIVEILAKDYLARKEKELGGDADIDYKPESPSTRWKDYHKGMGMPGFTRISEKINKEIRGEEVNHEFPYEDSKPNKTVILGKFYSRDSVLDMLHELHTEITRTDLYGVANSKERTQINQAFSNLEIKIRNE